MKLILCTICHDVYKLTVGAKRTCKCGHTWGYYLDDGLKAEVSDTPDTIVLGFHNGTLVDAIRKQRSEGDRDDGFGHRFTAFIIPDNAPTVTKVKERCTMGVGCEEHGVCYAVAHGQPDQCGRS